MIEIDDFFRFRTIALVDVKPPNGPNIEEPTNILRINPGIKGSPYLQTSHLRQKGVLI